MSTLGQTFFIFEFFLLTPLASIICCYFVSLHLRVIKFEPWLYTFVNDVKGQIRLWPIECIQLLNILSTALFITQIKLLKEANYYITTALNNMNVTALLWLHSCSSILPFDTNHKKRSVVSGTSPWSKEKFLEPAQVRTKNSNMSAEVTGIT